MMKIRKESRLLSLCLMLALVACYAGAALAQDVLPQPQPKFKGNVGLTYKDSAADFPQPPKAPKGAPNVLIVLLDDTGFGHPSTFGGPCQTPTLDSLSKGGLRYNQFHTTALCSPTRAALLTGRNHHSVNTGVIMEMGTGYDGYTTVWPRSTASIAEILKDNGYNTAAFGKWHNTPDWETSMAGPFDRWPTGLGFEYWYGFMGGDADQWNTPLYENTAPIEKKPGEKELHLTTLLADKTISWIRNQRSIAPGKPFFVYFAPGATHAPHQVAKEWADKYKGKFDQGWDKLREETLERQKKLGVVPANTQLTPRPKELLAWDGLSADQKRLFARMMEVYAGFLEHTDYEVGRVIESIRELGEQDNTIIVYIAGDNGSSAEGGPEGSVNEMLILNGLHDNFQQNLKMIDQLGGPMAFNHFPAAWAWAGDSPFQWTKQVASHFGGTRNGMVIQWPRRITDKGAVRTQFHHVIDIVPTILEATGISEPNMVNGVAQKPIEGVSMLYTFDDAAAKSRRRTQYFEMFTNRAIYHDGWIASSLRRVPWLGPAIPNMDDCPWELYNIEEDFSQANDLAAKQPRKLRELQDLFWAEAARYNVLPLDDRSVQRFDVSLRPSYTAGRTQFTYYPGTARIPEGAAPDTKNKTHSITAQVQVPKGGADGMLVTLGGRFGGWGLMVQEGKLVYVYNFLNQQRYVISSGSSLPEGPATLRYEFTFDGGPPGSGGTGRLFVNGKQAGEGRIEHTIPLRYPLSDTFDVGEDTGTPVAETYALPFKYAGKLEKVTIELGK